MGATIRRFRGVFLTTAGFSLLANLLWVLPSIYFLQVFDRVLTSRSNETLWMLTLLTMVALWMAGVLDGMRGRLLSTTSVALEQQLSGKVLAIMLTDAAQPRPAIHPQHGLRDVAVLRGVSERTGTDGAVRFAVASGLSAHHFSVPSGDGRSRPGRESDSAGHGGPQ